MTTLVLSVTRGPLGHINETRHVSSGAFEIGRGPPSDWILDDPNNIVSKRHCVFRQDEWGWSVVDVSRNGSFLSRGSDTFRLGQQPHRLSPGERLQLGAYEFAVDLQEDEESFRAMPPHAGMPQAGAPPQAGATPSGAPRMSRPQDVPPFEAARPASPAGDERWRNTPPNDPYGLLGSGSWVDPREAERSYGNRVGLSALLEGALLAQDDIRAPGSEADVLRAVGGALRATVSELRRTRLATLGEPGETPAGSIGSEALPLAAARTERDALRWLLAEERKYDLPPEAVIEAAFAEFRHHHDCLIRAARLSVRSMFESLDPDEPERTMLPHWLDFLPGWRHARSAVLARRRYRRMRTNLDRVVDQALARSYWDVRRDTGARVEAAPGTGGRGNGRGSSRGNGHGLG